MTSILVALAVIADQVRYATDVRTSKAVTEQESAYLLSVLPFT